MKEIQFKAEIIKAFADAGYIKIRNCIFIETVKAGIAFNYKIKVRSNDKVIEIEFDTTGREEAIKVIPIVLEAKESYPKNLAELMIKAHADGAVGHAIGCRNRAIQDYDKAIREGNLALAYNENVRRYQYENVISDIKNLTF